MGDTTAQENTVAIAAIAVQVRQTTKDLDKLLVTVTKILDRLPKAVSTAVLMWGTAILFSVLGGAGYYILSHYEVRVAKDHVQDMQIKELEIKVLKLELLLQGL